MCAPVCYVHVHLCAVRACAPLCVYVCAPVCCVHVTVLCACAPVCVCVCAPVCCVHVCLRMCVHLCAVHVCAPVCCECMCMCVYTCVLCACAPVCVHLCACAPVCVCTCVLCVCVVSDSQWLGKQQFPHKGLYVLSLGILRILKKVNKITTTQLPATGSGQTFHPHLGFGFPSVRGAQG